MDYKWKHTGLGGVKAQIAGEAVESIIDQHGGVTPEILLQEATKKRSVLHSCFEWDDTVAAQNYRLDQARYILRQIEVVIEREDKEPLRIRAFHCVEDEEQCRRYITITQARSESEMWDQVVSRAMKEIKQWQDTYRGIKEFEVVFAAIAKL